MCNLPQFKHWFIYFLIVFIAVTLGESLTSYFVRLLIVVCVVTEVYYLNVALALFNTGRQHLHMRFGHVF